MKVKLLHDVRYPAAWAPNAPHYSAGDIVPVVPATNQPDFKAKGLMFIDTPELADDCYGILISSSDYTIAGRQEQTA
jgi:hypothetical protein